jgi:hypothetical protein
MSEESVDDDLPDMGEIYQAISHILSLVVHYGKTFDDEQPEACKDGDLRDWAGTEGDDFSDSFKEGMV